MTQVNIQIQNRDQIFFVGDSVTGIALVTLPTSIPISDVAVSFHCEGKIKWTEFSGSPYDMTGFNYYDAFEYHQEELEIVPDAIGIETQNEHKKLQIPFSFKIPADKNLPSSLSTDDGSIQYYVQVSISEGVHKFSQQITVHAPMEKDLMIAVGGSAEKRVLLHGGLVSLHASIVRKGFAPGETIMVHLSVDNQTNAKVVPRVALNRTEIYMCEVRHKSVETSLSENPITGSEVGPHSRVEELLPVPVPVSTSLSIKSTVVTVKYFLRLTLDIPHSFDLHVNLPLVLTSGAVIDQLREQNKNQAEIV